jgi:predicted dehydrogenase
MDAMTDRAIRPITFSLIGGGWRAEAFLHIARTLPERFRLERLVVRDATKGRALEQRHGVATYRSLDELLAAGPGDFVVVCIGGDPGAMIAAVAERGMPVLAETPPSRDEATLRRLSERGQAEGWRVQIAEQYPFVPLLAAQIALAASGKLGRVQQAHVSVAHGYHGLAVMRRLLGWGLEPVRVRAQRFDSTIAAQPGRTSLPDREGVGEESRRIATLVGDDGRVGIFDFCSSQYADWIRGDRVQVRGERGELADTTVRWMADHRTPLQGELQRRVSGQDISFFEGLGHQTWSLGDVVLQRSPFPGSRLTDDELAIAECLLRMADHVAGGPGFYGLDEACHDAWLEQVIERCVADGTERRVADMPWQAASRR